MKLSEDIQRLNNNDSTLTSLYPPHGYPSIESLEKLAQALQKNTRLTRIYLYKNVSYANRYFKYKTRKYNRKQIYICDCRLCKAVILSIPPTPIAPSSGETY